MLHIKFFKFLFRLMLKALRPSLRTIDLPNFENMRFLPTPQSKEFEYDFIYESAAKNGSVASILIMCAGFKRTIMSVFSNG